MLRYSACKRSVHKILYCVTCRWPPSSCRADLQSFILAT